MEFIIIIVTAKRQKISHERRREFEQSMIDKPFGSENEKPFYPNGCLSSKTGITIKKAKTTKCRKRSRSPLHFRRKFRRNVK